MADIVERMKTDTAERREQFGDSRSLDLMEEGAAEIEVLRGILMECRRLACSVEHPPASTAHLIIRAANSVLPEHLLKNIPA